MAATTSSSAEFPTAEDMSILFGSDGKRNQAREVRALQDTIYVIGGKWKLPIINAICNGNKRFREIERSIPGITTRMLSRELKEMEMNKLITRTVSPGPPVLVEYESTDYCKTFGPMIMAMIKWGIEHREKIKEG
ncbi:helix-turn-helix domain-containing protein [Mucilaginibacter sabulilitoris]|uniref:Helix-turn-helix domain-containing protein n=1 Tax=Mucilaginibacter sabulilitoris TaxID=1173583 RepID=A0ABZ0TN46_9SPHI|nr:helix-turn-helix domain-containing protein [Mucilaginibacter sabulilitoris]WPU92945.1 helix-turn-helix domain-containing protein [Mucilaginibacter sabulilitoris]